MFALMVILFAFILCCFFSSKSLFQGSRQIPRYLLDTSSIQALLSRFLGFCSIPLDRYPDPPSQIIWSLCLLNSTSIYRDFLPLITPRCLSIYRAAFFIYSLRSDPILLFLKYFDFSLSSRDLNISLSKITLPIKFSALSKSPSLGKCS